jgi:hypothetical protein
VKETTSRGSAGTAQKIVRRFHPGSGTDLVALLHDEVAFQAVATAVEPFLEPDFTLETRMLGTSTDVRGLRGPAPSLDRLA